MKIRNLIALAAVVVLMFSCQNETVYQEASVDGLSLSTKKGADSDFMVIAKSESLSDALMAEVGKYGTVKRTIPQIGIMVVKPNDDTFEAKVSKLAEVKYVAPDLEVNWLEPMDYEPMANPPSIGDDDKYFKYQWGLDAINAPEAWNAGYTGEGARVAILDSGMDGTHPDLSPNINTELSTSFVPDEDWMSTSSFNHGTHVAGIVAAADNYVGDLNTGVIGVAPHAELVAVKVLSEFTGSGAFSWINAGIVYAADIDADVINMSLGAAFYKNGPYAQAVLHAQQRAIDYAFRKGTLVVTSAGNNYMNADGNRSIVVTPADLNNVVAVSATAPYGWAYDTSTNLDLPASYSNIGRSLVTVGAPGGDFDHPGGYWYYDMVLSSIPGGWGWMAGTSQASPHVAGVAALIIGKNGGEMDPHEVEKQLVKTADKIDTNGNSIFYGKGRVNAYRAVTE